MKSLKVYFLLIMLLPTLAFANDFECDNQKSQIKKLISNINAHKKLCESLSGRNKVKCYSNLSFRYNVLSRAMFYAENTCTTKSFSMIKELKKGLL